MIQTRSGMHIRRIVALDLINNTATVRGFGRVEQRLLDRNIPASDLRADGGLDEIVRAFQRHQNDPVDDGLS